MVQAEAKIREGLAEGAGVRYGIWGRAGPYKGNYPPGGESVSGVRQFTKVIIGTSDHRWSLHAGLQIKL